MTPIDAETADLQPPSHTSGPAAALPTSPERPRVRFAGSLGGLGARPVLGDSGVGCGAVIER
jgi:hypothetical protein